MVEWIRVWVVTTTWRRWRDSPHQTTRLVRQARTAAELRVLIEAARADPLASYSYRSQRILDGKPADRCRNSHRYWSPNWTRFDWAICGCGGHHIWICLHPGCSDVRVEPDFAYDCTPTWPRSSRHRAARPDTARIDDSSC
ncbi:hypothetical protein GCM10009687_05920 [Asanoa iriomotensis]|uniref:Uncharacterized protein n=1 Tax=Asanoa iriomotensis TaxID=234613 RepID=A0ABQ4C1J8_9ACTN|nr:hypothetical protein Air01nite_27380 [Asanoa iriomotensis]